MESTILDDVSITLAVIFFLLVIFTWSSKSPGVRVTKLALTTALLVVNIIDQNVLLSFLWGGLIVMHILDLALIRD